MDGYEMREQLLTEYIVVLQKGVDSAKIQIEQIASPSRSLSGYGDWLELSVKGMARTY